MRLWVAALVCTCRVAFAAPDENADTQAARRHYERGRELYKSERYTEACTEFATARTILALAALDYNLAKCEEHRENWERAIAYYEAYISEASATDDVDGVRTRVAELRTRIVQLGQPPPPPHHTLRNAAIGVGVSAVVLGAVGTGVYLSEWSRYSSRESSCQHACAPSSTASLRDATDRVVPAGIALWSLAGAAVVTDVILWAVETRHARERRVGVVAR